MTKIDEYELGPIVRGLAARRIGVRQISAHLREDHGIRIGHAAVARYLNRIEEAEAKGEDVPPIASREEIQAAIEKHKKREKKFAARKAKETVEVAAVEAPLSDGLCPKDVLPEHDSYRISAVIDSLTKVARHGFVRLQLPRHLLRQMWARQRAGPGGVTADGDPAVIDLGLYLTEADTTEGDDDDMLEVAQVFDRRQRLEAAKAVVHAIQTKYRLSESHLKISAEIASRAEADEQGQQTKRTAEVRTRIEARLGSMSEAVLALVAMGHPPDEPTLRAGHKGQMARVVDMAPTGTDGTGGGQGGDDE